MKLRIPVLLVGLMLIVLLVAFTLTPPKVAAQNAGTPAPTEAATEAGTQAANNSCSDFVKQALTVMDKACVDTGRNEACYGSVSLKADPRPDVTNFQFSQPGNIVKLSDIQTLQLSALNADNNTWGVVLMRLQANLPGTAAGQFVTMLLFGDVQIQNAATPPTTTLPVTIAKATTVLSKPVNGSAVGKLAANDTTTATGRLKDDSWLRVQLPGKDANTSIIGWINIKSIPAVGNVDSLDIIDPAAPFYGPMQAFYFQTGVGQQSCNSAPPNGILIQTPRGGPKVTMMVNDAKLTIGSSAFINSDSDMTISTFEGAVTVEAKGQQQIVPAGLQVTLPLGADKKVSGPPAKPVAFKVQDFQSLLPPLQHLPNPIGPASNANTQPANQTSGTSGGVCPAGVPYKIVIPPLMVNGQIAPGSGTTTVAPCHCANGSHTVSQPIGDATATMEVCN